MGAYALAKLMQSWRFTLTSTRRRLRACGRGSLQMRLNLFGAERCRKFALFWGGAMEREALLPEGPLLYNTMASARITPKVGILVYRMRRIELSTRDQ